MLFSAPNTSAVLAPKPTTTLPIHFDLSLHVPFASTASSYNNLHRRSLQQEGQPDAAEGDTRSRVDHRFVHHDPFTRRLDRMMGGWSSQAAATATPVRPSSSNPQQAVVSAPTTISSNAPTSPSAVIAEDGPQHE